MKETPLAFKPEMVCAILREERPKTQTRRILRMELPPWATGAGIYHAPGTLYDGDLVWVDGNPKDRNTWSKLGEPFCVGNRVGDRIWVREAWRAGKQWDKKAPREITSPRAAPVGEAIFYPARSNEVPPGFGKLRRGMFMCRWMSRITLLIVNLWVERLQDISEEDAKAEGCDPLVWSTKNIDLAAADLIDWPLKSEHRPYANAYALLWESINGEGSWRNNPLVLVREFELLPESLMETRTRMARVLP